MLSHVKLILLIDSIAFRQRDQVTLPIRYREIPRPKTREHANLCPKSGVCIVEILSEYCEPYSASKSRGPCSDCES